MDVKQAIKERRAYRSFEPVTITDELVKDLAESAGLAPSCFNNQPWRYVFVYGQEKLRQMHAALSKGNAWAEKASMIIAVYARKGDDCAIKDREYFLFDAGMSVAFMLLRATELGLVAHPIAGYDPEIVRKVLNIPDDHVIITIINVGKHSAAIPPYLSEKQVEDEKRRPPRMPLEKFAYKDGYAKVI